MRIAWLPNFLTSLRIVGTLSLLFIEPVSACFYVVYALSGVTDALDGFIARATNTSSEFGKKLDSVADLLFYSIMIIRTFPLLWEQLPGWIWIWFVVIVVLRIASYGTAFVKTKGFASLHTKWNKATGLCVFLLPFFISHRSLPYYGSFVCFIATLAAVYELKIHIETPKTTE